MPTDALQGILHEPYGLDHPYKQGQTERFPRDPVAGESVSLGALTWPAGAAEAVWAKWHIQDEGDGKVEQGVRIRDDAEGTYWKVNLPSFEGSQRVSYELRARQQRVELASETCSFFVPQWHRTADVLAYQLTGTGLQCGIGCPRRDVVVAFEFRRAGLLHVSLRGSPPRDVLETISGGCVEGVSGDAAYTVVEESARVIRVASEAMELRVDRNPYRVEVLRKGGVVALSAAEPMSWLIGEAGVPLKVREAFACPPGEAFYGFGERFNALDNRGYKLDVRVFDQYKSQERRTYIPVPFFLSSRGYGLYLSTARYVAYDLAASEGGQWSFEAEVGPDGVLEYDLIVADDPKEILISLADLTAKPDLPPVWAFGPWMSGNEWNSQARVMNEVARTFEEGIPATVLVIEAWSDEATFYVWNDARYTPVPANVPFRLAEFEFPLEGDWPDPKGMIDELHRRGIRVLLWQIPVMKKLEAPHAQHDADETHMLENGYAVQGPNGEPYRIRPSWFRGGLVLDFTNDQAVRWWLSKRAYLLEELGVDGFKTDGGEHLWGRGLRFTDGRRGDEIWNLFPNLYVGAYHRFVKEKREGDAVTFSRSGFAGAQSFPCHWAGDEDSTWEAFRASILAGLNAGLSGIPFWGWDLGGFGGEIPSAELYLRAAALAVFCPIMQYHSEYNEHRLPSRDRTPWNIQERSGDPDVIPVFRKYTCTRMNLLPYVYSEAWKSSRTGIPLMRPLVLEFPDDPACRNYPYQYLFGESLLVSPVVEEGRLTWPVYLPAGRWHDLWTGEAIEGPGIFERDSPKGVIPVFAGAGTILPLNLGPEFTLGSDVGNALIRYRYLCFWVYPQAHASYDEWHDATCQGTTKFECRAGRTEGQATVRIGHIDHDYLLAIKDISPSGVCVNELELPRAEHLRCWQEPGREEWCLDPERPFAWVRLRGRRARTIVELA